jgi:hypothetical protein
VGATSIHWCDYSYDNNSLQQISTNINTSAPKIGQTTCGNLLRFCTYKCFGLKVRECTPQPLLNPVGRWRLDHYIFVYSPIFSAATECEDRIR